MKAMVKLPWICTHDDASHTCQCKPCMLPFQKIVSMHPRYGWMHASHGVMFMDGLHASPWCDVHGWIACNPLCDGHGWIACMMEPCLPAWHRSLSLCHMLVRGKREEGREREREREREIRVKTSALIALLLYLFRWVPSLQEFSLGMLFVTNLQRGHVYLSCFSLVDDGLLSVFLSWVFLFCSLISCCCWWWVAGSWDLERSEYWGRVEVLMLTPISVEEIWIWSLISASSVLVVVIGFSSELSDLLFWLLDLFLFCFSVFVWMGWRWRAWKIWAQEETKKAPSDWRRS